MGSLLKLKKLNNDIELEFRAEIPKSNFKRMLNELHARGKLIFKTKRLSVMYFGKVGKIEIDIRVRITNGVSEVVIKRGGFHSHNRIEVSQPIDKNQFIGMVKLMMQLGFTDVKVGERETYNFDFGKGVIVSLVKAGNVSYIEVEKMTTERRQKEDKNELIRLAKNLQIDLFKNRKEFIDLCNRLTATCDWRFNGSVDHYRKLEKLLNKSSTNFNENNPV